MRTLRGAMNSLVPSGNSDDLYTLQRQKRSNEIRGLETSLESMDAELARIEKISRDMQHDFADTRMVLVCDAYVYLSEFSLCLTLNYSVCRMRVNVIEAMLYTYSLANFSGVDGRRFCQN